MKKKGFTLIELLAVIVILAIIALIATPIILNIISDSKEESNKRSIEMYAKAINNAIVKHQLDGSGGIVGSFETSTLENKLKVEYDGNVVCKIIEMYADGNLYLDECKVNGEDIDYVYGKKASFANDSWETISKNVKAGYMYEVGDTKEIYLEGFPNEEPNSNGLYTVRIANNTTPSECNSEGFSQTACGFVIEFEDIITNHNINSIPTNVGGYPDSVVYEYLQNDIYESLLEDLRQVIIKTKVVSGHGSSSGETNFISEDKLYLLSPKEVYGKEGWANIVSSDTAETETRQLDYYKDVSKVTTSSPDHEGAIKNYNGTANSWWLRTARSNTTRGFHYVINNGSWQTCNASDVHGIAPAFRIG